MTKAELIQNVWEGMATRNLSKTIVNECCDCIFQYLEKGIKKDKRFVYPGFGTWTVRKRNARTGRNPQTGAKIQIKASKTVTFRPCPKFKEML